MTPRGIRNHNPGNLMDFGINWQGLDNPRADAGRYCRFTNPVWGIRAMMMDVRNDWSQDGKRTVGELIAEYAPKGHGGNDPGNYAEYVAAMLDVEPDEPIDLNNWDTCLTFAKAAIQMENGMQPYTDATIGKALTLAGVERPVKTPKESKTVSAASGIAIAGGAGAAVEAVSETIKPLLPWVEYAPYFIGGLILVLAGVVIFERVKKMREGVA